MHAGRVVLQHVACWTSDYDADLVRLTRMGFDTVMSGEVGERGSSNDRPSVGDVARVGPNHVRAVINTMDWLGTAREGKRVGRLHVTARGAPHLGTGPRSAWAAGYPSMQRPTTILK